MCDILAYTTNLTVGYQYGIYELHLITKYLVHKNGSLRLLPMYSLV